MSKLRKRNIKSLLTIFSLGLLIIGVLIGYKQTYSSFIDRDEVINDFEVSDFKVDIEEEFAEQPGYKNGAKCTKTIEIANKANSPAFIRVMLLPVVKAQDPDEREYTNLFDVSKIKMEIKNPKDWILAEDGYFYYLKSLQNNKNSSALIEEVGITLDEEEIKDINNESAIDFNIQVKVEGISTAGDIDRGNAAYQEAWFGNEIGNLEPKLTEVNNVLNKYVTNNRLD